MTEFPLKRVRGPMNHFCLVLLLDFLCYTPEGHLKFNISTYNNTNDVTSTYSNISDVTSTYSNTSDVTSIYGNPSDVTSTYSYTSDITSTYSNTSDVTSTYSNTSDVTSNYSNTSDVTSTYSNTSDVTSTYSNTSDVTNGVDTMMNVSCNGSCAFNQKSSCHQAVNKSPISVASANMSSLASANISSGASANIRFNLTLVDVMQINSYLKDNFTERATLETNNNDKKYNTTLKNKNNRKIYNANLNTNNSQIYNATLNTNNNGQIYNSSLNTKNNGQIYNVTLNVNDGQMYNATLNTNNNDHKHNASLKVFSSLEMNSSVNTNKIFNTTIQNLNTLSHEHLNNPNKIVSVNEHSNKKLKPNVLPRDLSLFANVDGQILIDKGSMMDGEGRDLIPLTPKTSDLQCFGCNGEVMLGDKNKTIPPPNIHCQVCLKTTFSFSPKVFRLVQANNSFLSNWTTSHSKPPDAVYTTCKFSYWFVKRPDGVCKRLYIYYVAMHRDTSFEDQNIMPHFMVHFLKHNFGFDVLDEWWPTTMTHDKRLEIYFYVARFLVYDVHRASIKDAVNQIRHISLMTYALRHRCKDLMIGPNEEQLKMQLDLKDSFELGAKMIGLYEHFSLVEVTNRSACICKVVLGPFLGLLSDINNVCRLGCFSETFYKVENELERGLNMSCLTTNICCSPARLQWLINLVVLRFCFHLLNICYM